KDEWMYKKKYNRNVYDNWRRKRQKKEPHSPGAPGPHITSQFHDVAMQTDLGVAKTSRVTGFDCVTPFTVEEKMALSESPNAKVTCPTLATPTAAGSPLCALKAGPVAL